MPDRLTVILPPVLSDEGRIAEALNYSSLTEGDGWGHGYGHCVGWGDGDGYGEGDGDGYGVGSGYGYGLRAGNGRSSTYV
jgi:hypothetical protein